ncbi:MAG: RHS repeat protein [Nitrospira sp.]|nr:RHS repeat protein [Nitrospira sp.]
MNKGPPPQATVALIFALIGVISSTAADISYVYDDAGRLRAVIDPATNTAVSAYDAVGNEGVRITV